MTVPPVAAQSAGPLPTQRSAALQELAGSLRGELALPGSPTYGRLTAPFNASVVQRPLAVAAVADAYDVAHVVRAANRHGMRVAVQCTGHGAGAALEGALLVHTGAMTECVVHPQGWARVGAGVRWRAVVEAAAPFGLTPLAGSSSGVGVVGYTTGGGLGPLARTFGAASDRVRALDVVTGSGRLLRVTATEHRDLFWALRGGKGAAGIVTAMEFDLLPLTHVYGGALHFDGADAARVLHLWRGWAPELPETATSSIAIRQLPPLPHVPAPLAGRTTVAVRLACTAAPDRAAALLDPLRAVASPVFGGTGVLPVTQLDDVHTDPPEPVPFQERATLLRELPAEAVDALLAAAGPGSGSPLAIVELRQLDGAVGRPGDEPSALCGRDAAFALHAIGPRTPETAQAVAARAQQVLSAVAPWSSGATLPNTGGGALAYDAATRDRLREVVRTHDGAGVLLAADGLR